MFRSKIKAGLILAALVSVCAAQAATGFKVPANYNLELVDGITDPDSYSRFTRRVDLEPGRHQIVVTFKGTFGGSADSQIVDSPNPLVIDIADLKPDQVVTFKYRIPANLDQARRYARQQKVTLTDTDGNELSGDQASYFILASETGFTLMRDYRTELLTLNRLYAPTYVAGDRRTMGMTRYGAPIIEATAASDLSGSSPGQAMTMAAPELSSGQQSTMSTSAKSGGAGAAVTLNQLINLYNQADDATKLKFVKYVMSN